MPSFAKPSFDYTYTLADELAALRKWRDEKPGRAIPTKRDDNLLVATWNVANLGEQERTPADHALIAEVCGWFDIVAVQEVKAQLEGCWRCTSGWGRGGRCCFRMWRGTMSGRRFCSTGGASRWGIWQAETRSLTPCFAAYRLSMARSSAPPFCPRSA